MPAPANPTPAIPAPAAHPTTLFARSLHPATTKADLDAHFGSIGPLRRTLIVTDANTGLCKGFGFVHYALATHAAAALASLHGSLLRGRRIRLERARPRQRTVTGAGAGADADGGLAVRTEVAREVRKVGKRGGIAMRTVMLKRVEGGEVGEEEAREAFAGVAVPEVVVLGGEGGEARCTFASWAEAGKAAAAAHGHVFHACVEALRDGEKTRVIVRNLPFQVSRKEVAEAFGKYAPVRELRFAPPKGGKDPRQEDVGGGGDDIVACAGFAFVEYFLVADAKYAVAKMNGAKIGGRVVAVDMAMGRSAYVKRAEAEENKSRAKSAASGHEKELEDADDNDEVGEEEGGSAEEGQDSDTSGHATGSDGEPELGKEEELSSAVLKPEAPKKAAVSSPDELARTVFVRNLLFETSAPELWKAMANEFGPVEQAVIVIHPVTRRPRGTAFVRFVSAEDADKAVEQAGAGDTSKVRSVVKVPASGGFELQGRQLMLSKAVDRSKARDLETNSAVKDKKADPRNLRLASIGQVKAGASGAQGLSEQDLARRVKSEKEKKTKLSRNPNAFVSDVRLSVRNLPREFDEKLLREMFLRAAQSSFGEVVGKQRKRSSANDTEPGTVVGSGSVKKLGQPKITHLTIIRDEDRKDRSKGYGFVQFDNHSHALAALHATNNNPKVLETLIRAGPKALKMDAHRERLLRKQWGGNRRLQVEFSVEDRRVVQVLERIKEKGKQMSAAHKLKKLEEKGASSGKVVRKSERKGKGHGRETESEKVVEDKSETDGKKISKPERRSALKRQRAEDADKQSRAKQRQKLRLQDPLNAGARQGDERRDGGPPAHTDVQHKDMRATKRQREWLEAQQGDVPDSKPKKPRRKRNAAESAKDARLDSLILAYKRKLDKGTKSTDGLQAQKKGTQNAAARRWFD